MRVLDIGCGRKKQAGAVGLDCIPLPGVDVVHDLNIFPYPFENEEFDSVIARHSLQHMDNIIAVMEEIHRIARSGANIFIYVPHYASDNYNTDPTHKTHFGYRSMNYFVDNLDFHYNFYTSKRFILRDRYMSYVSVDSTMSIRNPFWWLGLEMVVNKFPRIYERFFVYWLPVSEIYFNLERK